MNAFSLVSFPNPLTRKQLTELRKEIVFFLGLRMWLISHCGVRHWAQAQATIQVYRQTWDEEAVQIHVHKTDEHRSRPPSFQISSGTNAALYDAGFLRFRYASVEEKSGQYQTTPFRIVRTWGDGQIVTAVLLDTTTQINNRIDSTSFFLLRRGKTGDWKMFRSWQLGCEPDSNAWKLGTKPLTQRDLAQASKLSTEHTSIDSLIETHKHLVNGQHRYPFEFGTSELRGRLGVYGTIAAGELIRTPELCAAYIDHLLFQPTSSPTRG